MSRLSEVRGGADRAFGCCSRSGRGGRCPISAAGILATFREIKGETFREAIASAQDIAATFGQDLRSSIVQVGKALNDPIQGVTALTRVGVAAWRRERMLPPAVLQRLPADRFLQGWCFGVRIETVRRLGGFDRSMRLYWSDTDFQARAMVAASGGDEPLVCCPNLPIRHLGHRTAARVANRSATWRADRAAFIAKWSPR